MKSTCPPDCHLAATHGLNNFRSKTLPRYFTNFLNGLTASLRTYETSEKHKNTTFFSRITSFLEPVRAPTQHHVAPINQRQRDRPPEPSQSTVEAMCSGQVNDLRKREFRGKMKVQNHPEIHDSAGRFALAPGLYSCVHASWLVL